MTERQSDGQIDVQLQSLLQNSCATKNYFLYLEMIVQVSEGGCCDSPGRESGPGTGTVPVAARADPELPATGTRDGVG